MELEKNEDDLPSIYQTAILGAEEILKRIESVSWSEKLLLKNDDFLRNEKYQKVILERMEFFTPDSDLEETVKNLETLFQPCREPEDNHWEPLSTEEQSDGSEEQHEVEGIIQHSEVMQIVFCKKRNKGNSRKIFLEICIAPYRIPFEIHLIPFQGHEIYPHKKEGINEETQEKFSYNMFPSEEYLALAFYEIIKDLELIKDMSWYKEVYEVLCQESADGRKVWESLNRLMKEYPIPSLEKRLDTLISYREYGYMKKRWKSQGKRRKEEYPQWEEVIALMERFLAPIFEGILKDEIFLGDWMPELGRYLD